MLSTFDAVADRYDTDFTQTAVGQAQRKQVWKLLTANALHQPPMRILELNCGTGEDALWLGRQGHEVLATDLSEEMVKVATRKTAQQNLNGQIRYAQLGMQQLEQLDAEPPFDLIFSNFGGINCLSLKEVVVLLQQARCLLTPVGRLVIVVMPTACIWETAYFLWKKDWKNAFRRANGPTTALLDGLAQTVHYHSPSFFRTVAKGFFAVERIAPVGCFVPPSYLNHYFENKILIMKQLENIDRYLADWWWPASISDHAYIQLSRT
jgi:ubiquinone/menaquinone biosynthesis C-methylase UbiE